MSKWKAKVIQGELVLTYGRVSNQGELVLTYGRVSNSAGWYNASKILFHGYIEENWAPEIEDDMMTRAEAKKRIKEAVEYVQTIADALNEANIKPFNYGL